MLFRSNIVSVSCGNDHSMYITKKGYLYATGSNYNGQLGLGDNTNRDTFTRVAENIISVSCGGHHSMYITEEGHLSGDTRAKERTSKQSLRVPATPVALSDWVPTKWTCLYATGNNHYGQLGLGDNNGRYIYEKVGESVVSVSCGHYHSRYITEEGHLYATGSNDYGQLGLGDNTPRNTFIKIEKP